MFKKFKLMIEHLKPYQNGRRLTFTDKRIIFMLWHTKYKVCKILNKTKDEATIKRYQNLINDINILIHIQRKKDDQI